MKQIHSKSFSFLLEFMLITLLFSLFAAVCVNIYASSITINAQANHKKVALHIVQNVMAKENINKNFYFDEEGNEVTKEESVYEVGVSESDTNVKEIIVFYEDESIINLPYYEGGDDYEA